MIERELKFELTPQEYRRIQERLRHIGWRSLHFTNFYFDTPKLDLRLRRFGLRIRFAAGRDVAVVTLKFPAPMEAGSPASLKARHEFEKEIPVEKAKKIVAGSLSLLTAGGKIARILRDSFPAPVLQGLHCLGNMKMLRLHGEVSHQSIELDKFSVFGETYYEMETETNDPERAEVIALTLLECCDVQPKPLDASKLQRFILSWRKKNRGTRRSRDK